MKQPRTPVVCDPTAATRRRWRAARTTPTDLVAADGVSPGSPTGFGLPSAPVKAFFDRSVKVRGELKGKTGAVFANSGGTAILGTLQALLVHGMIVQGRAHDKHYGVASVGTPNREAAKLCGEPEARTGRSLLASRVALES